MLRSMPRMAAIVLPVAIGMLGCDAAVRDSTSAAKGRRQAERVAADPPVAAAQGSAAGDFWRGLERHEISLAQRLLLVKGSRGIIACPYLNIEMFKRTGEACAIVPAANIDGMVDSQVTAVTPQAQQLGIEVGMSGREALDRIR